MLGGWLSLTQAAGETGLNAAGVQHRSDLCVSLSMFGGTVMIGVSAMASEKEGGEAPPLPTQSQKENH
jgi:hypothetical protein